MSDRTAATAGFVLAGVALAVAFGAWPGRFRLAAAGLSALAAGTLFARRHGVLAVGWADGVAAVGGLGSALVALASLLEPTLGGGTATLAPGPAGAALAGVGAAALAYADWRRVPRDGLVARFSRAVAASAVGLAGLLAIVAWSVVVGVGFRAAFGDVTPSIGAVLSSVALGLGTGSVAWFYLRTTDRGVDFLDLRRPTWRDAAFVVGGVVVLLGLNLGIGWAFQRLGLPAAQHTLYDVAREDPGLLLVLIPLSYLFVGPGEELLYRNIVQKSLYGAFSRPAAVVVASAVFAAVHVPAYSSAGSTPLSILNTLTVVFGLALVLGVAYERTRSVVVTALIHATFNAIAFASTYAELAG